MEINGLLEAYLTVNRKSINNLVQVAFDELESEQYEEAVTHFDQLYIKDPNDFMSYFLRAYSKSRCGVIGNCVSDSEKLTAVFEFACKKAIASEKNLDICLPILLKMYAETMEFLANNAVEEDEWTIWSMEESEILNFAKNHFGITERNEELKNYVVSYLKEFVDTDLERVGPVIVSYEPSYQEVLDEKIREKEREEKEIEERKKEIEEREEREKAVKIIAVVVPFLLITLILTCCLATV